MPGVMRDGSSDVHAVGHSLRLLAPALLGEHLSVEVMVRWSLEFAVPHAGRAVRVTRTCGSVGRCVVERKAVGLDCGGSPHSAGPGGFEKALKGS